MLIFQGEILRKRREIDPNWFEGTNSKGQIGIFPKCYVQPFIEGQEEEEDINEVSVLPDRPKTPKIVATNHPRLVFFAKQESMAFFLLIVLKLFKCVPLFGG